MNKFIMAKFLDFKMIDSKTVVTQVQELQVIIHDLLAEGLIVNDAFQVATIIEKLPPLWKNFKNYLKHKRKEMTVEDLIVRLRIEEDNKAAEKRSRCNSAISGVSFVEEDFTKLKKRKKASGPKSNHPKKNSMESASTVVYMVIGLLNVGVLRRTRKRRIKQTWLNPKEKWMISVQCFQNVTWLEIQENGG